MLSEIQRIDIIKSLYKNYPNQTWKDKLNRMKDNQLWALFQTQQHQGGTLHVKCKNKKTG